MNEDSFLEQHTKPQRNSYKDYVLSRLYSKAEAELLYISHGVDEVKGTGELLLRIEPMVRKGDQVFPMMRIWSRNSLTKENIDTLKSFQAVDAIVRYGTHIREDGRWIISKHPKAIALIGPNREVFMPKGHYCDTPKEFIENNNELSFYKGMFMKCNEYLFSKRAEYENLSIIKLVPEIITIENDKAPHNRCIIKATLLDSASGNSIEEIIYPYYSATEADERTWTSKVLRDLVVCYHSYQEIDDNGNIVWEEEEGIQWLGYTEESNKYFTHHGAPFDSVKEEEPRIIVKDGTYSARDHSLVIQDNSSRTTKITTNSIVGNTNLAYYPKKGKPENGYTPARNFKKKWGLIDENGKELYPFAFDRIDKIYPGGIAQVRTDEGVGLVDNNGTPLFPLGTRKTIGYISPDDITKYFIIERHNKYGFMGPNYSIIIPCEYDSLSLLCEGYLSYKLANFCGILSYKPYCKIISGYSWVRLFDNEYSTYSGDLLFRCRKQTAEGEVEDIINTSGQKVLSTTKGKIKYIVGDVVVEANYFGAKHTYCIIYSLSQNNEIARYDGCDYSDGKYLMVINDGKWGIFDLSEGKELVKCKYNKYEISLPSDGLINVKYNNKYGYIDLDENWIIPPVFIHAGSFSEGLAPVYVNGKWGFIDKNRRVIIDFIYDSARCFSEGLAATERNGLWGYINTIGETIIPFRYKSTDNFDGHKAHVSDESGEGYITASGEIIDWEVYQCDENGYDNTLEMLRIAEADMQDDDFDGYWIDRL